MWCRGRHGRPGGHRPTALESACASLSPAYLLSSVATVADSGRVPTSASRIPWTPLAGYASQGGLLAPRCLASWGETVPEGTACQNLVRGLVDQNEFAGDGLAALPQQ